MKCPECGAPDNHMIYPLNRRLSLFTCFDCGADTPFEDEDE